VINSGQLKIQTIASCLGEGLEGAYIETANNATQNPTQTQSTVVGASGTGFVPNIAASQSAGSNSNSNTRSGSGSQPSGNSNNSGGGTNASSKTSIGGLVLASVGLIGYLAISQSGFSVSARQHQLPLPPNRHTQK